MLLSAKKIKSYADRSKIDAKPFLTAPLSHAKDDLVIIKKLVSTLGTMLTLTTIILPCRVFEIRCKSSVFLNFQAHFFYLCSKITNSE